MIALAWGAFWLAVGAACLLATWREVRAGRR